MHKLFIKIVESLPKRQDLTDDNKKHLSNYKNYPALNLKDFGTYTIENPVVAYKRVFYNQSSECVPCRATLVLPPGSKVTKPFKSIYSNDFRTDEALVVDIDCSGVDDKDIVCTSAVTNYGFPTPYYVGRTVKPFSKFNDNPYESNTSGIHICDSKEGADKFIAEIFCK